MYVRIFFLFLKKMHYICSKNKYDYTIYIPGHVNELKNEFASRLHRIREVQVDVFTEGNLSTLYGHLWFGSGQGTAYNNYSNKKHNT